MDYQPCKACRTEGVLCVTPAYCKAMRYRVGTDLGGGSYWPRDSAPKTRKRTALAVLSIVCLVLAILIAAGVFV
jgi:hypothetical protein